MIAAVIFDLDGVLVDTDHAHVTAYERLFAAEGVPFSRVRYQEVGHGRPREVVIRAFVPGADEGEVERLMAAKEARFLEVLAEAPVPVIPGARDAFDRVRRAGLPVAVATASASPWLVLPTFLEHRTLDVVVDRTMVGAGKPAPDVFVEAARRLGVPPSRCLVVEDSPAGIRAARAASCRVVALATTRDAALLREADVVATGFADLPWGLLGVGQGRWA